MTTQERDGAQDRALEPTQSATEPPDAEAAPPTGAVQSRPPQPNSLWRAALLAARFLAIAFALLFAGSILWATAYRFVGPPGSFIMLDRALKGAEVRRDWVPLSAISPHLVRAVIAGEDSKFCSHQGFDIEAIEKAARDNKSGKKRRGASTLTQQTAKNAFLWNEGGWLRKGVETWFAALLDALWPKRRVMEVYLNLAEWGDGLFGAEAAAQGRFGKSARALTKQEAALLAAVLPSPNKWRVDPPGPYVKRRAATLRKRMDIVARDGLAVCALPL